MCPVDQAYSVEAGAGKKVLAWPAVMVPLVARYGASRVWDAGLIALEFPPTLVTQIGERDRVAKQLRKGD